MVPVIVVLATAVFVAWYLREQQETFYTDAETIRAPLEEARLREILWQPAQPLARGIE